MRCCMLPSDKTSGPMSRALVFTELRPWPATTGSVQPFHDTQVREGAVAAVGSKDGKRVEISVLLPQPEVLMSVRKEAVKTAMDGEST